MSALLSLKGFCEPFFKPEGGGDEHYMCCISSSHIVPAAHTMDSGLGLHYLQLKIEVTCLPKKPAAEK